jgi:hypothetical protein
VHYVQNVTDVDDPLFERAARDGVDWRELGSAQTQLFREDMAALRVLPLVRPRQPQEAMALLRAYVIVHAARLYQPDDKAVRRASTAATVSDKTGLARNATLLAATPNTTLTFVNGIATTSFEATASNESTGRPLRVRIDADLRRADLRWGAVTPTADVVGTEPLVVDALLQNQGPGNLMVSAPRIDAPAGATVLSASFTSPDGLQIISAFLGRYPYWDGLPSGNSVRVRLTVQLPAGLSGPQMLRLRTPASADPASGNDTVDVPFIAR